MDTSGEDERPVSDMRRRLEAERQRLAELRRRAEEATSESEGLRERMIRDRLVAADQADRVADQADAFAAHLEGDADGPEGEERRRLAARERQIAALERRNAARLRAAGAWPLHLETPPRLHDDGSPGTVPGSGQDGTSPG